MIIFRSNEKDFGQADMSYNPATERSQVRKAGHKDLFFNGVPVQSFKIEQEKYVLTVAPEHAERIFDLNHVTPL
jgi:hypothetical protein